MSMTMSIMPVVRMRRGSDAYALHVTTYKRGVAKSIVLYRLGMPWPASFPMIHMNPADETLPYMFVADENSLQLVARTLAMEVQMDLGVERFGIGEDGHSVTGDSLSIDEDEHQHEHEETSGEATDEASEAEQGALKIVFRLAKIAPDRAWTEYLMGDGDGLHDRAAWTFLWQYAATVYDGDCLRELQTTALDGVRLILGGYQSLVLWSLDC